MHHVVPRLDTSYIPHYMSHTRDQQPPPPTLFYRDMPVSYHLSRISYELFTKCVTLNVQSMISS